MSDRLDRNLIGSADRNELFRYIRRVLQTPYKPVSGTHILTSGLLKDPAFPFHEFQTQKDLEQALEKAFNSAGTGVQP